MIFFTSNLQIKCGLFTIMTCSKLIKNIFSNNFRFIFVAQNIFFEFLDKTYLFQSYAKLYRSFFVCEKTKTPHFQLHCTFYIMQLFFKQSNKNKKRTKIYHHCWKLLIQWFCFLFFFLSVERGRSGADVVDQVSGDEKERQALEPCLTQEWEPLGSPLGTGPGRRGASSRIPSDSGTGSGWEVFYRTPSHLWTGMSEAGGRGAGRSA